MTAKKIALFIDADNISSKFGKQIIDTLEKRGEIFIRRIYGNWEKFSLHGWNDCIKNFSLRAVQQPDFVTGKNATDMSLTIDAMDVFHESKAEIFALVSNDSDFTPLAIRLREGGMTIIGLGSSNAAVTFRAACNEFIELDARAEVKVQVQPKVAKKISPPVNVAPVQMSLFDEENISTPSTNPKVVSISDRKLQSERDKKIQQLHKILREAAVAHGDAKGFLLLNLAGHEIKSRKLGFGVKDFGYGTLQNFVDAFPKLYELHKQDNTVRYRCRTSGGNSTVHGDNSEAQRLKQIHGALYEAATIHGDQTGFADLTCAGQKIHDKNLSIKGLGHSTLQKFIAAFPQLYEVQQDGKIVRYRCRQIQK